MRYRGDSMEHQESTSPGQRQQRTRGMLEECGALIEDGHFVYASGDHGPGWIAKDVINMNQILFIMQLSIYLRQMIKVNLGK